MKKILRGYSFEGIQAKCPLGIFSIPKCPSYFNDHLKHIDQFHSTHISFQNVFCCWKLIDKKHSIHFDQDIFHYEKKIVSAGMFIFVHRVGLSRKDFIASVTIYKRSISQQEMSENISNTAEKKTARNALRRGRVIGYRARTNLENMLVEKNGYSKVQKVFSIGLAFECKAMPGKLVYDGDNYESVENDEIGEALEALSVNVF
ncbi:hypothetical protein C0J52_08505 [Blattella germanica]|nr:hypothetical protein C0J52_08505 [Blattella germanica]